MCVSCSRVTCDCVQLVCVCVCVCVCGQMHPYMLICVCVCTRVNEMYACVCMYLGVCVGMSKCSHGSVIMRLHVCACVPKE